MKKYVTFILFILLIIIMYLIMSNKEKDYDITYDLSEYQINEKYVKDERLYYFSVTTNDNNIFKYTYDKKYSRNRRLVKDIAYESIEDYSCMSIKINKDNTPTICSKDNTFYDYNNLFKSDEYNKINTINNFEIFNDSYDYYSWNGYGFTNILTQEKINFLNRESYDNNISYLFDKYILIADYDQDHSFNKIYVYNLEKKKLDSIDFDYSISFNSYFMGDVDNFVYLFDKKNKCEYKINVEKNKLSIVSNEDGIYYDGSWRHISLNKLSNINKEFSYNDIYKYNIIDGKLYYNYRNIDNNILLDNNATDIIKVDNDTVLYIDDDKLYEYNLFEGKKLLVTYFEWNFSYKNKLFIFDNKK